MNLRCGLTVAICLAICLVSLGRGARSYGQEDNAGQVLRVIRAAMAARDLPAAKAKLEAAAKVAGDEAFVAERERLQALYEYLDEFWKAVDEGAKKLGDVEELVVGDVRAAVVEFENGVLVLRVAGQNRRYTAQTLPAKVALTLAQRVLKPDAPANKVRFGAFLLMDGRGDRELAAQYLADAQKANISVDNLLPELKVVPVATLPVELPPVTPVVRKLLAPGGWYLRRQDGARMMREPLKDHAEQLDNGHLKVSPAGDLGDTQLVCLRKIIGNFGCRVVLLDVGESQAFGLFASDSLDAAYQVSLPKGSVMIELARQGGMFQCRINQKEVAVQAVGDASPNMPGVVGLTLPAGSGCTVAWLEFQGR